MISISNHSEDWTEVGIGWWSHEFTTTYNRLQLHPVHNHIAFYDIGITIEERS